MDKSTFDPPIPYIGSIYEGKLSPGKMIRIQGLTPGIAYRFDINLQCGPQTAPRDDVSIQVSVRVLDGYISLNSLHNGIWGEEQRGELPIKQTENFEIIVLCESNQYKVAINGQHYCEFPQRIHHNRVTHLAIDGDVSIFKISYESIFGGDAGARSGSGLGGIPEASSMDIEGDEFEMIDTADKRPLQPKINPPSPGLSQLPSYEAAINAAPSSTPYTTSAPYSTGPSSVYPSRPPYPIIAPVGMPFPNVPESGIAGSSPYPSAGTSRIPPSNLPIPLNARSSNFYPVKRTSTKKQIAICCAVLVGIILIIVIVVSKVSLTIERQ